MKEARHATNAMNGSDNGGMASPLNLHPIRTATRSGGPVFLRETVQDLDKLQGTREDFCKSRNSAKKGAGGTVGSAQVIRLDLYRDLETVTW